MPWDEVLRAVERGQRVEAEGGTGALLQALQALVAAQGE